MATIKDVAKAAGVSISTVSRVINGKGAISEALRSEVIAAMERLDYHPNELARSLHRKRTNVIGLVVLRADFPFFSRLIQSIETSCTANGYRMILCTSAGDFDRENSIFNIMRSNKVDGVILTGWAQENPSLLNVNMPIVTIDREIDPSIPLVACDGYEGGRIAARTLIEGGCLHPVTLCGEHTVQQPILDRMTGFSDECMRLGVECRRLYLPDYEAFSRSSVEYFRSLFAEAPDIDGFFSVDDVAVMCRYACAQLSVNVPERLQIIGYDGLDLSERFGVTTISQPLSEMGALAFELLMKLIDDKVVPSRSVLPVKLIRRSSTV